MERNAPKTPRPARWIPTIAAALVLAALAAVASASEEGVAAADRVDAASYTDFLDTWLYTHVGDNRGIGGPEHDLARDKIAAVFGSYGLTVTMEPFEYGGVTYHNVVGTKTGTVHPEKIYVVGAHFDSVNNPGADDDASGVACVLEAARIMGRYDCTYTLRFIAFDREEQGLKGSQAYVADHLGDGAVAEGEGADHAYATGGTFTATFAAIDWLDRAEDTVEVTVGMPVEVTKLKGKLDFRREGRDSLQVRGELPLREGFVPGGRTFVVDAGGATVEFVLDDRGRGEPAGEGPEKCKLRLGQNRKTGLWSFKASLKKGDLAPAWEDEGLVDAPRKNAPVDLRIVVSVDDEPHLANGFYRYSCKAGKAGKVR